MPTPRLLRPTLVLLTVVLLSPHPSPAQNLNLTPAAQSILDQIYSGDLTAAIDSAKKLQQDRPDHPIGYLLEDEAISWKIWCTSAEYRYGMSYARRRAKLPEDQHYFDLASKIIQLSEHHIAASGDTATTADMHFYAGMGDALLARLYSLRAETRTAARYGIRARERLIRAVALDPNLADADFGLGLYNYYADTLSSMAKMLRFFMGIPGGNKQEGIRQLDHAISAGALTPVEARFYLAISLHNYDQKYEQALEASAPLEEKYPTNPIFHLIRGDLYAKLGRKDQAIAAYRAAAAHHLTDPDSDTHVQALIHTSLQSLGAN
ncbi:MAG TPA: tetratricopeptide repeat protein [Candidatus Sulfotelmatobacter sp.]|nr:tetratricopeptide repeat protein [Candidatus Sulfotelmatobacter sp.]